ncbi:MAG: T9SS type A sorting domain-containing protein [Bacteroidetes bacterium]|nr:T9SS type A sorting domain-containing protein [Bacteroidota bacterium]
MKNLMNNVLAVIMMMTFCYTASAQNYVANDSVTLGFQNTQVAFYHLSSGTKTLSSNTDWHLALTVRNTQFPGAPLGGTTIRINEAFGSKAYYVPNAKASDFSILDTTGYSQWTLLHDSDSAMDFGCLNKNKNDANIYDFGWGVYNSISHHVVGDSLYLIKLPDGGLKKLWIEKLLFDTAFLFRYANIDNSDLQIVTISKKDYAGKNFVYLNMITNQILDKEPLSPEWDLQFTNYAATDLPSGKVSGTVGVLCNKGISVAEAKGNDAFSDNYASLFFSENMNAIGWDWKFYRSQTDLSYKDGLQYINDVYGVEDSLVYFVRNRNGEVYKLVFTSYSGNTTGKIKFYVENMSMASALLNTNPELAVFPVLYPNPVREELNVLVANNTGATFRIYDLSGRLLTEAQSAENITRVNTSGLENGVYLLSTSVFGATATQKFIVAR